MKFSYLNRQEISDQVIRQITVSVRVREKWLFVSQKGSDRWGFVQADKRPGEASTDAARRILSDHFGIVFDRLCEVCPYLLETHNDHVYGMLYFAEAYDVPRDGEFLFKRFDKLPDSMESPSAAARLFFGTQGWLNMQSNPDELWDVYDCERRLTGRLHRRGDFLADGDYHLVVHVWLYNSKGEFLLTKRAPNKGFPNTWETTGGAALAGDDSQAAAIREVREETGLIVYPENAERIFEFRREDDFCDVWLVRQDFKLEDVVLLEGETIDKMYCDKQTLLEMYEQKKLVPYSYLKDFLDQIDS